MKFGATGQPGKPWSTGQSLVFVEKSKEFIQTLGFGRPSQQRVTGSQAKDFNRDRLLQPGSFTILWAVFRKRVRFLSSGQIPLNVWSSRDAQQHLCSIARLKSAALSTPSRVLDYKISPQPPILVSLLTAAYPADSLYPQPPRLF